MAVSCLKLLFEGIDILCVFVQSSNVFICDFVGALKVCQCQLYSMYVDNGTSFGKDDFGDFVACKCSYKFIH